MANPVDHIAAAQALVTPRYALSDVLGTVSALAEVSQNPDDVACQMPADTLGIETSVGVQLALLADLVGAPVIGDETQIRALIRTSIRKNRSSGTLNDVLDVLDLALVVSIVNELFPAYIAVELYLITVDLANTIDGILQDTRAAGVGLHTVASTVPAANTFRFAPIEGGGAVPDAIGGWNVGLYAEGVGT